MKRITLFLLAALLPLSVVAQVPSYSYGVEAGSALLTSVSATAAATSPNVPSANHSSYGNLIVTASGITGSPSGCTFSVNLQGANSSTAATAQYSASYTPSNGVQFLIVSPTPLSTDLIGVTYACSTYPTAGFITVSFSPIDTILVQSVTVGGDPCVNASVAKTSVAVNVSSATTTQLVALTSGKQVYVCGVVLSLAGTAPTTLFEYGTGASCGSGTTSLTGTIAASTGTLETLGWGGTMFTAPTGNALCIVTGGTGSPSFQGVLTYVQQ